MVIDYFNPIVIISNFLLYAMQSVFAYLILTPRLSGGKLALFSLPFFAAGFITPVYLLQDYSLLRSLFSSALIYAPLFLFYADSIFKRLLTLVAILFIAIVTELAGALVWTQDMEVSYFSLYGVLLSFQALLFLAATALYFRLGKNAELRLADRERAITLLIPFTQFVSLLGWLRYLIAASRSSAQLRDAGASLCVMFSLIVLTDYLFFRSPRRSLAAARLETENTAMAQQLAAQERYYATLEGQFAANRAIRHDISNHLYTIRSLLAEGRHADAEHYASEYLSGVEQREQLCEEPCVNAYLLYKSEELRKAGIELHFDVTLGAETGISSVDLVAILGNLLDNASEAVRALPSPTVTLRIAQEADRLLILEENPLGLTSEREERIPGLSRGNGFGILSSLAQKYGGAFTHESENGRFRATLSLNLK